MGLVDDTYLAYCFDEAVLHFGTQTEAFVNEAGKKAKNDKQRKAKEENALRRMLGLGGKFRDGMDLIKRPNKDDEDKVTPDPPFRME